MPSLPLLILYGSQTGNAQDAAERVAREARARGVRPRIMPMDAYPASDLPSERLVVFIVSTTGQGVCPDNMRAFWKMLLRKSLPPDSLAGVGVATFGLGDSGYLKYNAVAKRLANRLAGLGAEAIVEKGLGDDQAAAGYEAALDPWLEGFWTVVGMRFGVPQTAAPGALDAAKFRVVYPDPGKLPTSSGSSPTEEALKAAAAFRSVAQSIAGLPPSAFDPGAGQYGPCNPYMAKMVKNERLTAPSHFQDVRHIEFDLGTSGLTYSPGDLLSIFPETTEHAVDAFLDRTGLNGDRLVEIQPADPQGDQHLVTALVRIRALVQGVLDIHGASPRRYFFDVLKHFASAEHEVERLDYFGSAEGRDDVHQYNQGEGRTVLEILNDFKSARPPLEWLLQICPLKQPRQFSISSSLRAHPGQAHITAAIVEYRTPFKRTKRGLCTSWLAGLDPSSADVRVPIWIERGALRMPIDPSTPMVLIGPGTGVAPFRSFLEERRGLVASQTYRDVTLSPNWLIFGCRNRDGDFFYKDQWDEMKKEGVLNGENGVITAFSRDQSQKIYVTHKIREYGELIYQLIAERAASIYVAGSAKKMPADVHAAIEEVIAVHAGVSSQAAAKFVKGLELKGRYCVESWS